MNLGKQLRPRGKHLPSYVSKPSKLQSLSLSTFRAAGTSQTNHSFIEEYVSQISYVSQLVIWLELSLIHLTPHCLFMYVLCNEEFLIHERERGHPQPAVAAAPLLQLFLYHTSLFNPVIIPHRVPYNWVTLSLILPPS